MTDQSEDVKKLLGLGEHRSRFRWRWWYSVLLIVLAAGSLYALTTGKQNQAVQYLTEPLATGNFIVTVSATGTVEPTNLVEISSELSGTLEEVNVDFNDTVDIGTVLASLDTTTLEAQVAVSQASLDSADARVAIAQATLEDAREKYVSIQDLDRRALVAHQELVTRRAAFARARAELQSTEADRKLAEANLALHQAELDKACICSPIAGVVLERAVDPGQIVAASFSAPVLFTLAEDLAQMELQVDVDEADIGRISVGDIATFSVDAYDEQQFPATIASIRYASETIDGVVTYKAILSVDNSKMLLRPGMTATAEIIVAEVNDALIAPNAALRYIPPADPAEQQEKEQRSGLLGMIIPDAPDSGEKADSGTVWVLRDATPVEISIETGETNGEFTAIKSGNVVEGDQLIIERLNG